MALFWIGAIRQIMAESLDAGLVGRRVDTQTFIAAPMPHKSLPPPSSIFQLYLPYSEASIR